MLKHTNVELIYNYTESLLQTRVESITQLNQKLSTFLGFSGLILTFSADLPNNYFLVTLISHSYNICSTLKILACLLSACSICISALGLTAQERGIVVSPTTLVQKWVYKPDVYCRAFIINTWQKTVEEFRVLAEKKAKLLNWAIYLLVLSTIFFALNVGLASWVYIFKICKP